MSHLYRKELRSLLPLVILVLLVNAADLVYEPLTTRLDQKAWGGGSLNPGEGGAAAFIYLVLALLASFSLFPREHDDRTIEFLQSLPVTRTGIFFAKVLAGYSVLAIGIVGGLFSSWVVQLPNDETFTSEHFRWALAGGVAFLYLAYSAVIFAHGVFISFFRRFGLVLYAIAAWVVIFAKDASPAFAIVDPTRLTALAYEGRDLLVPWPALAFHGGLALVALLAAWFLWTGPAERVAAWLADSGARVEGKIVLGCGTGLVAVAVLAFVVYYTFKVAGDEGERVPVRYEPFQVVHIDTARFRFTYPSNLRRRALTLVARADAVYEEVRAALGARAGNPIVVDMTDRSSEHAGIASWQKVRLDITGEHEDAWFLHVFEHELVHAFEFQESTRRVTDHANATKFFMEGLAEHVAHRLVKLPRKLAASRGLAVAAVRRHRIRFDELIDADGFRAKHDGNLVYPIGETWCEGLVRVYGPGAPGNVLRSMAREDAPRDLAPLPFWQDTLQAAGYDLERVVLAWRDLLAEVERADADFLRNLPRLSGGVSRSDGDHLYVTATLDRPAPEGATFFLRVRDNRSVNDSEVSQYRGRAVSDEKVEWRFPRAVLNGPAFEFQLGIACGDGDYPYYEDWQQGVRR